MLGKKVGVLWSKNETVIDLNIDLNRTLIHPNVFVRETTFRPLGRATPSIFLHALQIHQGLLEHTPRGSGVSPKTLIVKT